jgi:glycosyltransferase involved in cell wall biosynthesis
MNGPKNHAATLVTVGMPVYNGELYVEGAIRSLLDQSHTNLEIVISDNCSTDETSSICQRLAAEDLRIRYVRQDHNIGAVGNFEYVLRSADSPFFMWAAHDDLWHPDFIAETLQMLSTAQDAMGAATAVEQIREGDEKPCGVVFLPSGLSATDARVRARSVRFGGWHAVYGMYRRDYLAQSRLREGYGADIALVFYLALQGRILRSDRVLRTQRLVGYDEVIAPTGRVVWKKALGPDALLYTRRPHAMSWSMLSSALSSGLPLATRVGLCAYVLRTFWWTGVRNAALGDSRARISRALRQHRFVVAGLLVLRHAILNPRTVASKISGRVRRP